MVKSNANLKQAHYFLVMAYLQSHQRIQARSSLDAYLRSYPGDDRSRALYEQEFGGPAALPGVERSAELMLVSRDVSARELTETARSIFGKLGRRSRNEEDFELVRRLLDKAIVVEPTYWRAHLMKSEALLNIGLVAESKAAIESALEAGIPPANVRYLQAGIALREEAPEEALSIFAALLGEGPATVDTVLLWANLFARHGSLDTSLEAIDLALKDAERDERRTLEVERIALSARYGETNKALRLLVALERSASEDEETLAALNAQKENLVRILVESEEGSDIVVAQGLIEQLQETNPGEVRIQLLHARILSKKTPPDFEGARAVAEGLLNSPGNTIEVVVTLASIAVQEGDYMLALDYARRAATGAPENGQMQLFLAEMQIRLQQYVEAQGTLERTLGANPNSTRAMELLVETYRSTGRFYQAEAMLDRFERTLEESGSTSPQLALLRGRLMRERGTDLEEAERIVREQFDINPDDLRLLSELVMVMAGLGREEEAEGVLRDYTLRHEDEPEVWVALGSFYLSLRTEVGLAKASTALTRALLLDRDNTPALRRLTPKCKLGPNGRPTWSAAVAPLSHPMPRTPSPPKDPWPPKACGPSRPGRTAATWTPSN